DRTLKRWDAQGNLQVERCLDAMPVHLRIHPNDEWVAVAFRNGMVRIFDLQLNLQNTLHPTAQVPSRLVWHPTKSQLFLGNQLGFLLMWEIKKDE
ncbi:MAG: hypothetical protein AAGJ35_12520, partial [Myxococcota bacterium]